MEKMNLEGAANHHLEDPNLVQMNPVLVNRLGRIREVLQSCFRQAPWLASIAVDRFATWPD